MGLVIDDAKHGRLLADAEQGARRHFDHVLGLVDNDSSLDPETIAKRGPFLDRIDEVDDHVDPLLFDAQASRSW